MPEAPDTGAAGVRRSMLERMPKWLICVPLVIQWPWPWLSLRYWIQAWDPDIGLLQAFRIIFAKQRTLFEIGAANRRRGYQPMSLRRLAQLHFKQQRLLDAYPPPN